MANAVRPALRDPWTQKVAWLHGCCRRHARAGIGATTAIFSLFDAVLLKSLPVHHPDELFIANAGHYGVYQAFRQENDVFSNVLAASGSIEELDAVIDGVMPEKARVSLVSASYFSTLDVSAAVGRAFGTPNLRCWACLVNAFSAHCTRDFKIFRRFLAGIACASPSFTKRQDDGNLRRFEMPAAEERLSLLEAKMEHVGTTLARMETILVSLDQKVDKLDLRVDRLDQRVDKLDDRFVKFFLWVIGIQMTTFLAIVGGLFGVVAKLI